MMYVHFGLRPRWEHRRVCHDGQFWWRVWSQHLNILCMSSAASDPDKNITEYMSWQTILMACLEWTSWQEKLNMSQISYRNSADQAMMDNTDDLFWLDPLTGKVEYNSDTLHIIHTRNEYQYQKNSGFADDNANGIRHWCLNKMLYW